MKKILLMLLVIFTLTNCCYAYPRNYLILDSEIYTGFSFEDVIDIDSIKIGDKIITFKEYMIYMNKYDYERNLVTISCGVNIEDNWYNRKLVFYDKVFFSEPPYKDEFNVMNDKDKTSLEYIYIRAVYDCNKEQILYKNILIVDSIIFALILLLCILFFKVKIKKINKCIDA